MYEETDCFDPNNSIPEGTESSPPPPPPPSLSTTNSHTGGFDDNDNSIIRICSMEQQDATAIEIELERQLKVDMEHNDLLLMQQHHHHQQQQQQQQMMINHDPNHQIMEMSYDDQSNWEQIEMQQNGHHQMFNQPPPQHQHQHHHHHHSTADLLNLFHLPRCSASSLLPNSSMSFAAAETEADPTAAAHEFQTQQQQQQAMNFHQNSLSFLNTAMAGSENGSAASSVLYDPLYHLNLPPQPPHFRDLFQSLPPHGYNLPGSRMAAGPFFGGGGMDDREASGGVVYQDGDNGVLEFTAAAITRRGRGRNGKSTNHFTTERQRRDHLNTKYQALKNLVPNPTKNDRASIVGDAIGYINELIRTVNELKVLVEKRRCSKERRKRHKTEEDGEESSNIRPNGGGGDNTSDQFYNGSIRCSWLQRKSKDTEVDVRIIDDDVTIKLAQRKKINCLLLVSKFLDDLHLDLQHVAGGHIGDSYSFLFNSKIYEGSSVYASAIANKLIEVVDRHYAAAILPATTSF